MLALTHARVLFGAELTPRQDTTVLIDSGKIVSVGGRVPDDAGCIINLRGKTVLPGLVDIHTHFAGSSSLEHLDPGRRVNTYDYTEAREGFLDWGVLTVRSCGDVCPDILEFRDGQRRGAGKPSPRLFAAGPWVQGTGAHPASTIYCDNPVILSDAAICVDDGSDLDAIVRSVKSRGADWLKLFYAGSPFFFGEKTPAVMSESCLRRLVRAGHENGMPVMVHVDGASDMLAAAKAGADSIEHVLGVGCGDCDYTPELLELLAEKQIAVVPTMTVSKSFAGGGNPAGDETYARIKALLPEMLRSGVKICAGCDSGIPFVPFGQSLHEELACLVDGGMTPRQALQSATSVNASVLGIGRETGTLDAGMDADLMITDGDPLEDISASRKICMVIKGGAVIRDRMTGCTV